ncbi:hypothetical protein OAC46_01795 [Flavobacteriaceae bacterium]|nr:hypothetical protein [Flavobacteriaceae bacterium]
MVKRKSHNFSLGLLSRDKKKPGEKEVSVYLFYSHGKKHSQVSTKVKIPKGSWNDKKKEIDIEKYPYLIEQQNTLLHIWKNKFTIHEKLKKGEISRITAFEEITERVPNESLRDFYVIYNTKAKRVEKTTYNQRLGLIDAIENKLLALGHKQFVPITFEHLSDTNTLERLYLIIKNEFGLMSNGVYEYTKRLDEFYNKRFPKTSPFSKNDFRPSYDDPDRTGVEYEDLLNSMYNINTLQDLETYLMYLYSICMRGLNGIDIFKMRDDDFVGETEQHFLPNLDVNNYDGLRETYSEKLTYHKVRGKRKNKTSKKMKILANLYPTNHIRTWLQWCIEINRPAYQKEEDQGYSLFRKFDDEEVSKVWQNNLRQTYTDKCTKIIGKSFGSARHTFLQAGTNIGIPSSRLEASVGQRVKEYRGQGRSLGNYVKVPENELHLIQAEIFDEVGIVDIFFTLVEIMKDRTPTCKSAESYLPPFLEFEEIDKLMKEKNKVTISGWSYLEEFKLNRMMQKHLAKEHFQALRKKVIKKVGSKEYAGALGKDFKLPYTTELKELVDKKQKLVAKNKKTFLERIGLY